MYETRLGLAKHSSPYDSPEQLAAFPQKHCSLEGQIADVADDMSYHAHDVDDGLSAGLITLTQLRELAFWMAW